MKIILHIVIFAYAFVAASGVLYGPSVSFTNWRFYLPILMMCCAYIQGLHDGEKK